MKPATRRMMYLKRWEMWLNYKRLPNLAVAALYMATLVIVTCMIGYMIGLDVLGQVSQILDSALAKILGIFFR